MQGKSHSAKLVESVARGDENPFWTHEAISEHFGMILSALIKAGYAVPSSDDFNRHASHVEACKALGYQTGDLVFEIAVIQDYTRRLFQVDAALMPDVMEASEVGVSEDPRLWEELRSRLAEIAELHQAEWEDH